LRMVCNHEDAKDITQEILIKIITKLSTYDARKSSFRTWLYRIVVNHVINMKKSKNERMICNFDSYFDMNLVPDERPDTYPGYNILIEELKISCFLGSLLCFNRKERLVFILGAIFNITDSVGSELLGITKTNFRKILSRGRKKLHHYMNNNCELFNASNPCHCGLKLKGHIKLGWINPDRIVFHRGKTQRVRDIIHDRLNEFSNSYYSEFIRLFREHPFYEPPLRDWLKDLLRNDSFKDLFLLK
jgi:RNA polymerase sigma factor (sigma-70 family)